MHGFHSKTVNCWIIHPVQSFHLQILEKGSQQFDGVVGQDDWQNSKPLVSWKEKKVSLTEAVVISWHPLRLNHIHKNNCIFLSDTPFARTKFWRSCAILGACCNISDTKGSKRIFLFPFICQCCGAQVQNQVQAVQKTPGSQQLKVLIMLKKMSMRKKTPQILVHFLFWKWSVLNEGTSQAAQFFIHPSMKHLLPLQLCASYWWLVQSFHRSPTATTEINFSASLCSAHMTTIYHNSNTALSAEFTFTITQGFFFPMTIRNIITRLISEYYKIYKMLQTKLYLHISGQLWLHRFHSPPL